MCAANCGVMTMYTTILPVNYNLLQGERTKEGDWTFVRLHASHHLDMPK